MFRKRKSLMLLVIMLLSAITAGTYIVNVVNAASVAGTLALYPSTIAVSTVNKTTVLPSWPQFTLQMNVTGVTNIYGFPLISVHWNTSLFDFVDCTIDTTCIFGTAASPKHLGDTYFAKGAIHEADGNMSGTSYTKMSHAVLGLQPFNVTATTWEKVLDLKFQYTGPTPSIGFPIDTDIRIVDYGDVLVPTYKMQTNWAEVTGYPTDNSTTAMNTFAVLGPAHFHYEAVPLTLRKPTASFYVSDPPIPPYYNCTTLTFDASASTGGCDGDTDPTPIKELHWTWGDTTSELYSVAGGNFTWTPTHHYKLATLPQDVTITLVVVAPHVDWFDPAYENTSDPFQLTITISPVLLTYIDVYTENERWPDYVTTWNGTGADTQADAYSPQENVTLFAIVLYKGDIVQNKLVAFYIEGPRNPGVPNSDWIYLARTAFTDANGIATITFRIPWPCTNAEARIFGTWFVKAMVSLAETQLQDTLTFDVGWVVEITSMQTVNDTGAPKTTFKKSECIGIKLNVTNLAKENRWALITIVIYDDVGAVIARIHIGLTIPAHKTTTFRTEFWCWLEIPKWAFVGPFAMAYANAYTASLGAPAGGVPWCPEASAGPFTITP